MTNLVRDAGDVLVLLVDLVAHGRGQALETAGGAVQGVQVAVNLVLHLVVLGVSLELVLGALSQASLLAAAEVAWAVDVLLHLLLALRRIVRRRARVLALLLLLAVRVDDSLVAGLAALRCGEGIGDVHATPRRITS